MYVLDAYYESPAGIERHWEDSMQNWAEDLTSEMQASTQATVSTLHSGTVINALW